MFHRSISCALLALLVAGSAEAVAPRDNRKKDPTYVTQKAMGEVDRTAGWCDDATTSPANVWASSAVPAELKTTDEGLENRRAIRFLVVRHVDATDAAVPMCVRAGPNTDTLPTRAALTCVGTAGAEATNGAFLRVAGEGRSFLIKEIAAGAVPQLWVASSTGSVRYCVEVSWAS